MLQALKTRIKRTPGLLEAARALVSSYFQRSLLDDFYRRQNDIIDSLMEACGLPTRLCLTWNPRRVKESHLLCKRLLFVGVPDPLIECPKTALPCQVDTLHSGEYCGDAVDEAEERFNRRAMQLSFLSNMCALLSTCSSYPLLCCVHQTGKLKQG